MQSYVSGSQGEAGGRHGTFWALEDPPPPQRPRWFCHWDGASAGIPAFESPEDAVAWGVARARTVIVRPLGAFYYWAGEKPSDWNDEYDDLRSWPPSATERREIDAVYERALAVVREEAAAREVYERERESWLEGSAPELAGRGPAHTCLLLGPADEDASIEFEELAPDGTVCGARRQGSGACAFGTGEEVIAATSGRPVGDPWLVAVCAALARERAWRNTGRRSILVVKAGEGLMFHVAAAATRESIRRHGLDWRRMGESPGIAGSREPELPGIFLCASLDEARFFTDMARRPSDVWAVRVDGLWLEGDPGANGGDNWMIVPEPVGPERLWLAETDVLPGF